MTIDLSKLSVSELLDLAKQASQAVSSARQAEETQISEKLGQARKALAELGLPAGTYTLVVTDQGVEIGRSKGTRASGRASGRPAGSGNGSAKREHYHLDADVLAKIKADPSILSSLPATIAIEWSLLYLHATGKKETDREVMKILDPLVRVGANQIRGCVHRWHAGIKDRVLAAVGTVYTNDLSI